MGSKVIYSIQGQRPVSYIKRAWLFICTSAVLALAIGLSLPAYAAPGDLDPTFDAHGMVTTGFGVDSNGYGVAINSNGKIIVGGFAYTGPTGEADFTVARYSTNAISTTDFNIAKRTFGSAFGQPGYDARGDFNKDANVNITDFTPPSRCNFGQAGPAPNCP